MAADCDWPVWVGGVYVCGLQGMSIAGVDVPKGQLRDVSVVSSDNAARKECEMTFTFGSSGRVPGNGKIVIIMPFGYYIPAPTLTSYNGLGRTGTPVLSVSGLILTIQLGDGHFTDRNQTFNGSQATVLDPTDGISLTIAGIINPGAGSTTPYILRTTFPNADNIIDEAQIGGTGISTGILPTRSVSTSDLRAGQANNLTLAFTTTGFIPDNALILLGVPNGLGLSLPVPTEIVHATCCQASVCTNPCNISVVSISGQEILLQLAGDGSSNLAEGASISVTLNNIRNLWSGKKEGFDITIFLSDGISTVLQAKDVDGPELVPGILRSAEAVFSETPMTANTYGAPEAGKCGTYRIRLQADGTLPAQATVRVTFPPRIQLNDPMCSEEFYAAWTRVAYTRTPDTVLDLSVDAQLRQVVVQIDALRSDVWAIPGYVEFFLTNIRHTSAGALERLQLEAMFKQELNVRERLVEHNRSVPLLSVVSPSPFQTSAMPQELSAGSRTQISFEIQTYGRLPRSGIIFVVLPPAFRINDGDLTAVIDSSITGNPALDLRDVMTVEAGDVQSGIVKVRIDAAAIGVDDGLVQSVWTCNPAAINCVRSPSGFTPGSLLLDRTSLKFTLSQIRNLAGGYSGDFEFRTYLEDGTSLVESKAGVPGVNLFVGNLSAGAVSPKLFGSAIRTSVKVSVTIANTLQASGYVVVEFPAGFQVNDGGATNVSLTWLTRYTAQYSTPSRVVETDEALRTVTVSIGGEDSDMLEALNTFEFTLSNIRNMVARPTPPLAYQVSGKFGLATRLQSGLIVEKLRVQGVAVSPNTIYAYPVGRADLVLESLLENSVGWITVMYSSDSVLPTDGVVSVEFPPEYSFNARAQENISSTVTVDYDGIKDPSYQLVIEPITLFDLKSSVEQALLTKTQADLLKQGLLYTRVRAVRVVTSSSAAVAPQTLVAVNITGVRVSNKIGETGSHNISVLTSDFAVIATGVIPPSYVGRPAEPQNIHMSNCNVNWPASDLRCLQVEWDPPLDDAGSPVTEYLVTLDSKSNAFEAVVQNIPMLVIPGLPLRVQSISLAEGVTHFVRVRAANAKAGGRGFGRPSYGNSVRVVSLATAPRPAILRSDTTNRLFVSWLPPQFTGALNPPPPILQYKIEFDRNGDTFLAINHNVSLFSSPRRPFARAPFSPLSLCPHPGLLLSRARTNLFPFTYAMYACAHAFEHTRTETRCACMHIRKQVVCTCFCSSHITRTRTHAGHADRGWQYALCRKQPPTPRHLPCTDLCGQRGRIWGTSNAAHHSVGNAYHVCGMGRRTLSTAHVGDPNTGGLRTAANDSGV